MEWVIWVIVIVLIIAIVWWLMSRGNTQNARTPGRVEHKSPAPPADSVANVPDQAPPARGGIAPTAEAIGTAGMGVAGFTSAAAAAAAAEGSGPPRPDEDAEVIEEPTTGAGAPMTTEEPPVQEAPAPEAASEPETTPEDAFIAGQLAAADEKSRAADEVAPPTEEAGEGVAVEDGGVTADDVVPVDPGPGGPAAHTPEDMAADAEEWEATWSEASPAPVQHPTPVHHHEYTGEHAPTLPGAESAAAESLAQEDAAAGGHLAAGQPYGEGSAAPGPDGSGPEGYTVKGDAGSMTYYDEDNPAYPDATAGVWFLSAAHAEAAGFRPPRRNRH